MSQLHSLPEIKDVQEKLMYDTCEYIKNFLFVSLKFDAEAPLDSVTYADNWFTVKQGDRERKFAYEDHGLFSPLAWQALAALIKESWMNFEHTSLDLSLLVLDLKKLAEGEQVFVKEDKNNFVFTAGLRRSNISKQRLGEMAAHYVVEQANKQ